MNVALRIFHIVNSFDTLNTIHILYILVSLNPHKCENVQCINIQPFTISFSQTPPISFVPSTILFLSNNHRTRPMPFDHANIADRKLVETAEAFNPGCVKENAEIESGRRGRRDRTLSASRRRQGRVAIPISHQVRPRSRLAVSLPSQRGWWWLRIIHGRRTPTIRRKFQRNARSPVDFRGEYPLPLSSFRLPVFSTLADFVTVVERWPHCRIIVQSY